MPIIITLKSGKAVVVKGESPFPLIETANKGLLQLTDANGNGYWPERNCIQDYSFMPQAQYDKMTAEHKEREAKQKAEAEAQMKKREEMRKRDEEMAEKSRALQLKELARREAKLDEQIRKAQEPVASHRKSFLDRLFGGKKAKP